MTPNFLFIGPDKAGSTWLWKMLGQHPEIYVAAAKDIYYFDKYYHRGQGWYAAHFRGAQSFKAVGEFSHDYLYSEIACERIKRDLPNVKLLTLLRNPVERAFSEYLFLRKHNMVRPHTGIRGASGAFPSIIEGGMYGKFLQMYLKGFSPNAIFIGWYSDINKRPAVLIRRICTFLGVRNNVEFVGLGERVLPASAARFRTLGYVAKYCAMALRRHGYSTIVGRLKHSKLIQHILYRPYGENEIPVLGSDDRDWLLRCYEADQELLEKLIKQSWKENPNDTV